MASSDSQALGPDSQGRRLVASGGRVRHFGPPASASNDSPDCGETVIVPGRVNAHTHIYSGLAPLGMPPPDPPPASFLEILERVWWRLDRALDESSLRASARLYAAEALLAGTTCLIDHHESPGFIEGSLDVLADACQEIGIRAVLCYGATERNAGRDEARRGLAECRRFIESNERPLVRGVVGLHASFTVSDETVREAGELCRELGTVLHVHVAEGEDDGADAVERGYPGPLERLLALDALPRGSILAHGIHLSPEQVAAAADRGLWFVQNPRSNRGNAVGYPRSLRASRRVALGTDGYPADMVDEAQALFELAAANGDEPDTVERRLGAAYELAGSLFAAPFSPLAAGGVADAIAQTAAQVRHVMVAGRRVVENGTLQTADLGHIRAEAAFEAARLWRRMSAL